MKKNTRTFDPVKKMSNQNSYKEKFQGGGGSLGGISRGFSTFQMSFECFFCDSFKINWDGWNFNSFTNYYNKY